MGFITHVFSSLNIYINSEAVWLGKNEFMKVSSIILQVRYDKVPEAAHITNEMLKGLHMMPNSWEK